MKQHGNKSVQLSIYSEKSHLYPQLWTKKLKHYLCSYGSAHPKSDPLHPAPS